MKSYSIAVRLAFRSSAGRFLFCCVVGVGLAGVSGLSAAQAAAGEPAGAVTAQGTGSVAGRVQNVVTGRYLSNARVAVEGTGLIAFTDEAGNYILAGVPAGRRELRVFYSGLDEQRLAIDVAAGRTTELNVDLTIVSLGADKSDTVKLGPFVVATARETDIAAIATNEQRFAPNLKNVVSTGSFGDVTEGNIGEFLKSLPGISTQYSEAEIISVSARGFGSNTTTVSVDGGQMANAHFQGAGRAFTFGTVSINNVSRVELTKVPTPATPADSLGGSINMVSKSAFERRGREFRYRLYLDGNSENLTLKATPHSFEEKTYKVLPGVDFDYTLPLTKNLGIVVTGLSSNHFNPQHAATTQYATSATGTAASISSPYLQLFQMRDGPRHAFRDSLSVKVDWRVTPHSMLSIGGQASYWYVYFGNNIFGANTSANGTPTIALGMPMSFGPDFVSSATGRGTVSMSGNFNTLTSASNAENVNYRFDDGTWRVLASANYSGSRTWFRNTGRGFFTSLASSLRGPLRVEMRQIKSDAPGSIQAFDNTNREITITDINNYTLNTANSALRDITDDVSGGEVSARRQISGWLVPASIQAGGKFRSQVRDRRFQNINWTYNGPDGNPATPDSPAPFQAVVYGNQDAHYGFHNLPWASPHLAWEAFQKNPALFSKTTQQIVAENTFRITNSERIQEDVSALYLQGETRLFHNRLNLLTGVRYERTTDEGNGPLVDPGLAFQRNANGSFVLDAAGNRVRRPAAGAAGSLEDLKATRYERGTHAKKTYDGFFPSLHLTGNVTENLLLRLAYARTYGRPDFTEIIPNATFTQLVQSEDAYLDPNSVRGTIAVRNPGLRPWTADNFDASLEYYTSDGGVLSVSVFRKELRDFFGDEVRVATAPLLESLGLDPSYVGWSISTKFNMGDARVSGYEFNVQQSLGKLSPRLRPIAIFANATKLTLAGNRDADFGDFIPKTANWGFTITKRPMTFMAKWNYRGRQKNIAVPALGLDAYAYGAARTQLDLNLDVQVRRSFSIFASARNALNEPQVNFRYGSATPAYARQFNTAEYGVQLSLGVKGSF